MGPLTDKNMKAERLTVSLSDANEILAYKPGTSGGIMGIISEKSMKLPKVWHCDNSVVLCMVY